MALLSDSELVASLANLPGWERDGSAIRRTVEATDFPTAIRIVDAVAEAAEASDHHPDIDIRWRKLRFTRSTHPEGGVTAKDVALARTIDGIAARHGCPARLPAKARTCRTHTFKPPPPLMGGGRF